METFSALWAFCAGNSPVTGEFPHEGQWRGALVFSLICARINGWVNNREAGDLRRHQAHYDVIVMTESQSCGCSTISGYGAWLQIGWHHPFVIGWPKYRSGFTAVAFWVDVTGRNLHFFQRLLTVSLHSHNDRQMPAVRSVKWNYEGRERNTLLQRPFV